MLPGAAEAITRSAPSAMVIEAHSRLAMLSPTAFVARAAPPNTNAQAASYCTRSMPKELIAGACHCATNQAPLAATSSPMIRGTTAVQGSEREWSKRGATLGSKQDSEHPSYPIVMNGREPEAVCRK